MQMVTIMVIRSLALKTWCSHLFFLAVLGFELRTLRLLAGAFPLESYPQSFFALVIFWIGSQVFGRELASDHNPPAYIVYLGLQVWTTMPEFAGLLRWGLANFLPILASYLNLPTYAFCLAGTTGAHHHAWSSLFFIWAICHCGSDFSLIQDLFRKVLSVFIFLKCQGFSFLVIAPFSLVLNICMTKNSLSFPLL
jgi:hypothetical protein